MTGGDLHATVFENALKFQKLEDPAEGEDTLVAKLKLLYNWLMESKPWRT
ncbi:hypothetical protein F2Q69_00026890 [Brassica cretica]|uniref:Uncharacterized protein n=1 Tax=Brassica cretica TaxID=69181 RepID=A0A8S9RW65_BRACR|nr:hypothetical protein F2Q69_00026890 [Brassica cretica]